MTKNRRVKKDTRARMERTGERYTTAQRNATLNPDTASFHEGRAFIDDHCANCMKSLPDETDALFCSPRCDETSKHIRYFRRVFRDGRISRPDIQAAVRIRIAFLLHGGYDALDRELTPQRRAQVKTRAHGLCQLCGEPGIDIDHIKGSSAALSNLQLLCKACHAKKTEKVLVPAGPEGRALIDQLMDDRVAPSVPRLLADDEVMWPTTWSELKKARRQRLVDELEDLDIDPRQLRTRAEMVLERDDARADLAGGPAEFGEYDDEGNVYFEPTEIPDFDGGYGPDSYFARAMNRDD